MKTECAEEKLREIAWVHAIENGVKWETKYFLIYPDGKCSEPLGGNPSNKSLTGAVARAYFENPYNWMDFKEFCDDHEFNPDDVHQDEFIHYVAHNRIPDEFEIKFLGGERMKKITESVQKNWTTSKRLSVRISTRQSAFFDTHPTISVSKALRLGLDLFIEAMERDD